MMLDLDRLDSLARVLASGGSRRRLLGVLSAVPVVGGLMPLLDPEDTDAKDRRRRRKQRHKKRKDKDTGKGKGKKFHHKKPKPQPPAPPDPPCQSPSVAQTCADRCGRVTDACGKTVDCGSCDCSPVCGVCFTCQADPNTPGACVVDPDQQGDACGDPGQVCQGDGRCACHATSCPACTTCGENGECAPCTGCCDAAGACQDGTTDAACGRAGTCEVCTGQDHCRHQECACTPRTTCPAEMTCGVIDDGCGGTVSCGSCSAAQVCVDHTCQACTSTAQCGSGHICVAGACEACNVVCTGAEGECGAALQAALDDPQYDTLYVCPGTYHRAFNIDRSVTVIGAGQDEDLTTNTVITSTLGEITLTLSSNNARSARLEQVRMNKGGGITNFGTNLVVRDCTVTGNDGRAALYQQSNTTLEMTRCTVRNNTGLHGGLLLQGVRATLTDCLIEDNVSDSDGGGLAGSGELTLAGTTIIRNNTVKGRSKGGGIYLSSGTLIIGPNCQITGNTAPEAGRGGGIYRVGGTVTLEGSDPGAIVVRNCHENCAVSGGNPIAGCAPGGFCPE